MAITRYNGFHFLSLSLMCVNLQLKIIVYKIINFNLLLKLKPKTILRIFKLIGRGGDFLTKSIYYYAVARTKLFNKLN
ncbi:hypothetical protein CV681_04770 [Borreliella burgdorferi]|nr:hypothetical protein CV681_04770 [Borreliella burgdorferi]PRR32018.1 hypothetical protein CV693_06035 [Borreliella burgdorferi]